MTHLYLELSIGAYVLGYLNGSFYLADILVHLVNRTASTKMIKNEKAQDTAELQHLIEVNELKKDQSKKKNNVYCARKLASADYSVTEHSVINRQIIRPKLIADRTTL